MIGITILAPALLATQAAAPVAVPVAPAAPVPETVAEFLQIADALIANDGDTAVTSSQADAIRTAIQQAGMAYRATLAETAKRGAPPTSCPPPSGQASMSLADIVGDFRAFPEANRSMPLPAAFALVMTLGFPCAGGRE